MLYLEEVRRVVKYRTATMNDPYRDLREYPISGEKPVEPQHVRHVLSEFIALKGLARRHGIEQLQQAWRTVAGNEIGRKSKVIELSRGVLHVGVSNSAILQELASFLKQTYLEALQQQFAYLKIRDLKFRLKTDVK